MKKLIVLVIITLLFTPTITARLGPPYDPSVTENNYVVNETPDETPEKEDNDNTKLYIIIAILALTNILSLAYIKYRDKHITIDNDPLYPRPNN